MAKEIVSALGYPHFAFLFLALFVLLFRGQIGALISRVTSIDKGGIKTLAAPEAQREKQKTEAVQELLADVGNSIALSDIEGRIRSELEQRGLETDTDTARVLVKYLGASALALEFERIHGLIFGSQIYLLKGLNEVVGQGRQRETIAAHFAHVQKLFEQDLGDWSLDDYMAFLIGRYLVTIHGDVYHITNLGVEYLTWIARNGRTENRPL